MNRLIDEGFTKENIKEFIEDMDKDEKELREQCFNFAKKQCDDYMNDMSIVCEKIKDIIKILAS